MKSCKDEIEAAEAARVDTKPAIEAIKGLRSANPPSVGTALQQLGSSVLEATSIGSTAFSRVEEGGEGTVDGAFDGAINIMMSSGLVSLVPEAAGRGPLNVTLPWWSGTRMASALGVRTGDNVIAEDHTLRVEDHLRVLLRSAGVYSPRRKFARPLLGRSGLEANVEVVKETALEYGNMGGLGKLLDLLGPGAARPGELNIFAASAVDRLVLLEEALYSGKEDELTGAVRGLIGLGLGLTPSSDDMLAGMVLLCVLSQVNGGRRQDACRLLAKVTAAAAPGRTTSLSAEYLRSAASGRGNERLTRLCASVLTGERDAVERETMRVLEIGETSGTDMVLGIVLGTMFCAGRRLALVRRRP